MGIPDGRPHGLFGLYTLETKETHWIKKFDEGGNLIYSWSDDESRNLMRSNRGGESSNRRLPLPGTTTLWVPPSSYSRSVRRYEYIQPNIYNRFLKPLWWQPKYLQSQEATPVIDYIYWEVRRDAIQEHKLKSWFTSSDVSVNEDENARARVITECLLKLKDQKVSLGEDLATAAQTYALFSGKSVQFLKGLWELRKGSFKGLRDVFSPRTKGASAAYLEYIYGVKPLMQDIYGAWELLNEQLKPAMLVHARRTLNENMSSQCQGYTNSPFANGYWDFDESAQRRDRCRLTGRVSGEYARHCARAGMINPLSVAWEVVPYSFIIDWAIPIGNVINAMDATTGLDFVGGYISRTAEMTAVAKWRPLTYDDGYVSIENVQDGILAHFQFSNVREKFEDFPEPVLYAKSPFSNSHAVTALALLSQITGRKGFA